MDMDLSESEKMLKSTAKEFLSRECPKSHVRQMEKDEKGYSKEVWEKMASIGWLELAFPQKYGGSDGSFLDLIVLLEEMGRACLPSPFLSTVILCGLVIMDAANEKQKSELLPRIISGNLIGTLALTEPTNSYDASGICLKAIEDSDGFILDGTKLFVTDAHIADYLICAARTKEDRSDMESITLFIVDSRSDGLSTTLLKTIGYDRQCEVVFNKVKVNRDRVLGEVNKGWPVIVHALERAALGKCAEMVGGGQQVTEMAVTYAKQRIQFGKPIGSFQAIQFYCARMLTDLDIAWLLTYETAWKLSHGIPCSMEVAITKAAVSDSCHRIMVLGHQIFGGIGFTEDHDMHLYSNRTKAAELIFGKSSFYRERIADKLGI